MKKIVAYLNQSKFQYLATIGLDGKPKVRPFQFMFEENGKLWFCTSNYKELKANPFTELCAYNKDMSWIRISAKAVFSNNIAAKERILKLNPLVRGIYKGTNNPKLEVFYLVDGYFTISEIGSNLLKGYFP